MQIYYIPVYQLIMSCSNLNIRYSGIKSEYFYGKYIVISFTSILYCDIIPTSQKYPFRTVQPGRSLTCRPDVHERDQYGTAMPCRDTGQNLLA